MVLAERNTEVVRNGRRSRGPSPNGHGAALAGGGGTPDTSSDDDNSIKRNGKSKTKQSEYEEKIRVGRDYQAVCPPLIAEHERKPEIINDRALLVWSPTKDIPDTKLEEYISVAKEKYGYNGEQALGMLFWHKHDLERAVMDLANFTPFPDEWTVEDKVLFEQAFQFHGKSFHRIRQMLPDKSIASLVKYYYSWKKTRHRQSVMDRQEKAKASKEGSENGSDNGSNEESDVDDKDHALASCSGFQESNSKLGDPFNKHIKTNDGASIAGAGTDVETTESVASATISNALSWKRQQTLCNSNTNQNNATNSNIDYSVNGGRITPSFGGNATGTGGCCANCGVSCHILNTSPHGRLCSSCHHHWRRTGNKRPTSGPYFGKRSRDRNAERHKRKPPRGMYINHDDIVELASANDNQDKLLANTDREIVSLLSQVQYNKQNISSLKRKNSEGLEDLRPTDNANRVNSRWSNEELLLAVQGVRKYGKDFQTIAETLGTKTEAHVRTFYVNYRRRYNLDQVLKEYESDKELTASNMESSSGHNNESKRKESSIIGESDTNTTSSETTVSKFTDEVKSNSSTNKDNIILEIDLDAEPADTPPTKKMALSANNQDLNKAGLV